MHRILFRTLLIGALILIALLFGGSRTQAAITLAFSNSTAITIPNNPGVISPYPSTISVSGLAGLVTDVDVTLFSISHSRPDDLDILLVGPGGQTVIILSDACGNVNPGGVSYTFSDQAASLLGNTDPNVNCITTGTYQPVNYDAGDTFGAPAPGPAYGTALSNFNGTNPNGTWSLYVVDDITTGSIGTIGGGWSLTITTDGTAPLITSAVPPNGTVGMGYSHLYTASGSAPITYSVTSGALPTGLTLTSDGQLSGTPTAGGTFTGVVTATNGVAPDSTQAFSITIGSAVTAPLITSAVPPNGTVGMAYSHLYTASGSTPITYSVISGALPTGLTLASNGQLGGTPTAVGTFTGVVAATNGVAPDSTQAFSITIGSASSNPVITSGLPPNGVIGMAYTHSYTASGTAPITYSVTSGALPTGLTLASDGQLSGTPTAVGTFTGVVTASNGVAPDDTQAFSIQITISGGGTTPAPYVPTAADHARAQAPLCADASGKTNTIIRADVPAGAIAGGSVFCRVVAQNGEFKESAAEIGEQSVLDMGVIQAVDVFGLMHNGSSQLSFNLPIKVCLQGSGILLYLDATISPRIVNQLPVSLEGGYTCATVYNAGLAVLVGGTPSAVESAPVGAGTALNGCMVTTNHILNLRAEPNTTSEIIMLVPYNVTLTAMQRDGNWFKVDYWGTAGWVNAAYVGLNGACG